MVYYLENISCIDCASEIQKLLDQNPLVKIAKLSFASGKLELESSDDALVLSEIQKKYPHIKISKEPSSQFSHTKITIILSLFILGCGFYFSSLSSIGLFFLLSAYIFGIKDIFVSIICGIKQKDFFNENTLMFFASIAAFVLKAPLEAVSVIVFYSLGEHLQAFALFKSNQNFNQLINFIPKGAYVLESNSLVYKEVDKIQVGEILNVCAGEMLLLDGEVIEGEGLIDTQAINGENTLIFVSKGTEILSGSIMLDANIKLKVKRKSQESHLYKINYLIQQATKTQTKTQNFFSKFASYYTPFIFFIAFLIFLVTYFFGFGSITESIYRSLVVLMVGCPCALVLSIPLCYFSAISCLSKNQILIKDISLLETLKKIKTIVFDKTGTLTKGELEVIEVYAKNQNTQELIDCALISLKDSQHIIAKSIIKTYGVYRSQIQAISKETSGKGVVSESSLGQIICGNEKMMKDFNIAFDIPKKSVGTILYVAKNSEYLGYILLRDNLRSETLACIEKLKKIGKDILILSGDRQEAVSEVAKILKCQYQAQMLPEEKYHSIQKIKSQNPLLFVGDGINDAPSISLADIGVSMGSGSDMGKNQANVVLLKDNLLGLIKLFDVSQKTHIILWENIFFIFLIKIIFIILGTLGLADIWEAIFCDVGVSILALLNALRISR